jgi:regulator of cell morphogenesis and NO signaling
MSVTIDRTVRDLALEIPAATRVFEKLGIDYCCGGNRTLEQACQAAHLPVSQVLDSLELATALAPPNDRAWHGAHLSGLIAHIQDTHHKYTREEVARLSRLFDKVCSVHGKRHPELLDLRATFACLGQELTAHMAKEEMILFPYIAALEQAAVQKRSLAPPPFGTVTNPVATMMHEHDDAGNALRDMRRASSGYTPPSDACISYQTLYQALAEFEADLHQHIHLENNVLFPRAIELEQQSRMEMPQAI